MSTTPTSSLNSGIHSPSPSTGFSEPDATHGVAIIGMACRTAGNVHSPEQLWEFLLAQKDGSSEIPTGRWDPYFARDSRNKRVLEKAVKRGYFVPNINDFDCQFFGISPKEAEQMDPQQRMSLEVAWEALQDAGIPASCLKGTNTAVFWGVNSDDYSKFVLEDLPNVDAWMGIGTSYCGVPNRISYHLDLLGPSVAVDAACASSLVAVHNGVSAIMNGESNVAIVGGVNALLGPGLTTVLQRAGALAADGRCRSFDDEASGYGRGEGAGAVILKQYDAAVRDDDHILAIVKGSAVAHDGKTNGIMAPNAVAQSLVARQALDVANIDPSTVHYVEAHATSTPLGDPTEVSAMSVVYGTNKDHPCFIGSVKPNIGHLEAGAGVMGVIKAVMALQKGILPPQANLNTLNTRVQWDSSGLEVVRKAQAWPPSETRRAAVCSYGYGGTVSHAVLENPPGVFHPEHRTLAVDSRPKVLLISAPQKKRLPVMAEQLSTWMKDHATEENLASICTTLATRRDQYEFRASAVIEGVTEALAFLDNVHKGSSANWMSESRCLPAEFANRTVWVFSGHGAQWTDMGKDLLDNEIFLQAVRPLDEVAQDEINSSPIEWLRNGDFDSTDRIQILTFIMQLGISAVLQSRGLLPDAIIGHSVGEIAASVVAGSLSPVEGVIIVTRRAVLYRQVMGQGAMILVNKPFKDVEGDLDGVKDVVAAIDASPSSCVVAGATEAVASITDMYKQQGIKTFNVKTDVGFHSPMMYPLCDDLLKNLEGAVSPRSPTVKLYTTALPNARAQAARDAEYWVHNMVSPVRLTDAIQSAIEDGYRAFLEVSSHPLVSHSITETLLDCGIEDFVVVPTLRRNQNPEKSILHSLCQLHCNGVDVNWTQQMPGLWASGLPTGPWLHQHTFPKISSGATGTETHDPNQHTLLGHLTRVADTDTAVYTTLLEKDSKPFPGDHPVSGTEIIPAACLLNTFLKASAGGVLHNVDLKVPVAIDVPRTVQVVMQGSQVMILSRLERTESTEHSNDSSWLTHTTATWSDESESQKDNIDLESLSCHRGPRQPDSFTIDYLAGVGVSAMGFPWKVIEHYGDSVEMFAKVDVAPDAQTPDWDPLSWAPLLDAATSIGSSIFFVEPRLRMPSKIQRLEFFTIAQPPKVAWLHVRRVEGVESCCDVSVLSESGGELVRFTAMLFSGVEGTSACSTTLGDLVHRVAWPPASFAEDPIRITQIVIVCQDISLRQVYVRSIPEAIPVIEVLDCEELSSISDDIWADGAVIAYIPTETAGFDKVAAATRDHTWQLLGLMKFAVECPSPVKVFVLTTNALNAQSVSSLASAPLIGLSRVVASEHPDHFGGLFDSESQTVPLTFMKYIQATDVVRIVDGVPRTARLRSLPKELHTQPVSRSLPRPEGTYLITGGLGPLGLATAEFLAEHGARRIVLVSRRSIPPRSSWTTAESSLQPAIAKIQALEQQGVSVHTLALDITIPGAARNLLDALERVNLPPVCGVVHAAGVLENQMILETTQDAFNRVLSPKIDGALVLHSAFPPKSVDFFMMFSSCGQLFGFPGQGSYGSGNTFLDTLATYRRNLGDNAATFQWSSWRGMGMGSDSEFVAAELESKGITDITRDEAFRAWMHLAEYDIDHGVILRSRTLESDEPLPSPLLRDIVSRSARDEDKEGCGNGNSSTAASSGDVPSSGPELRTYLDQRIRECVGSVLHLDSDDVDSRAALSDLGLDSVMSVAFRRQLTQTFKIPVPPTLTWNHPTVEHLVKWFVGKMEK